MIKQINYNGFSTVPSDYDCPDGDLAAAINLIPEEGHLRPIATPSTLHTVPAGYEVVFIHKTSGFTHYIVLHSMSIGWYSDSDIVSGVLSSDSIHDIATLYAKPSQLSAIGNTLLALTPDGLFHFLWKADSSSYLALGIHIPELPISFGLQGEMVRSDSFKLEWPKLLLPSLVDSLDSIDFVDENKEAVSSQVLAKVNAFIAEKSVSKGKFIFPFFVRYAFRLYDGSLTMHSSPILMMTSSWLVPQVILNLGNYMDYARVGGSNDSRVAALVSSLDYAVVAPEDLTMLKNWSDIVKSVDVFISAPLYVYDQSKDLCDGFCKLKPESVHYSVCRHLNPLTSVKETDPTLFNSYLRWSFTELYENTFMTAEEIKNDVGKLRLMRLPMFHDETVIEKVTSSCNFYLLKSIPLEELQTTRTVISVPEDYLQSLVAHERMTDDYDSHDKLIPGHAFVYNSRMNITRLTKYMASPTPAAASFPFTTGAVSYSVYIYLKKDGREIIVKDNGSSLNRFPGFSYFYYPDPDAFKAEIRFSYENTRYIYTLPLKRHDFLNGAFFFNGMTPLDAGWPSLDIANDPSESTGDLRRVEIPNKIYTSEVNNPFSFPVAGINTVGAGEIIGLSSAAKALSQGQFGQFPLYAFATDGVWALEVGADGSFRARQSITRDVCLNPESITQIDSAVLFATDRGIMLISGSQTRCITDAINSETPFNVLSLTGLDKLHTMIGHDADSCFPLVPFSEFLSGCGMVYDYVHQRIVLFSSGYSYAYVYSLKSGKWGMAYCTITKSLKTYPDALACRKGGSIVDLSKDSDTIPAALLVTRPFKLEDAGIMKTVDTVIQRGDFDRSHVKSVLYGSRDLSNWHLVASSVTPSITNIHGTPYKFFRIALVCTLGKGESVNGFSMQFTPRLTNRLR